MRTPHEVRENREFGLAVELVDWAGNYTSDGSPERGACSQVAAGHVGMYVGAGSMENPQ